MAAESSGRGELGGPQAGATVLDRVHQAMVLMDWEDRIEINPAVLVGKPVIRGTRLAVEFIVELLANRWSEQQIIENYPGVTHEDISACLRYAADVLKSERVYLAPTNS